MLVGREIGRGMCGYLTALVVVLPLLAQRPPMAVDTRQADVEERLGEKLPLGLVFRDSDGQERALVDFFNGERPVLLMLNYSDCPKMCGVQQNAVADVLERMRRRPGNDFEIVTLSINPTETPERAKLAKQRYVDRLGEDASRGWHFLVGDVDSIDSLAKGVGYTFRYLPQLDQFDHPTVMIVCSPDGRVMRYIYGDRYEANTIEWSLVEASEGRIATTGEKLLLLCLGYDSATGRYSLLVWRVMEVGVVVTTILLVGSLWWLFRQERIRRSALAEEVTVT